MAATPPVIHPPVSRTTGSLTTVTTLATAIAAGKRVVVAIGNVTSVAGATLTVTDSVGNTYTVRPTSTVTHTSTGTAIADATITTTIPVGGTITVTQSGTTTANGWMQVLEFTSELGAFVSGAVNRTGTTTFDSGNATTTGPYIAIGMVVTSKATPEVFPVADNVAWVSTGTGGSGGATRKGYGAFWRDESADADGATIAMAGTAPGSSAVSSSIATYSFVGSTPPPTPGTAAHVESAPLSSTSFSVVSKTAGVTDFDLLVSTASNLSSPTVFQGTVGSDGWGRATATGLSAGTQYYYAVADTPSGGTRTTISEIGKVRTLRTGTTSFTFAAGSCTSNNATDGLAHAQIAAWNPDFFIHMGDFHYQNPTSTDSNVHAGMRATQIQNATGLKGMLRDVGLFQINSDHDDGPGDNLDSTGASTVAAIAAYRLAVASAPLIEDVRTPVRARYYSHVQGRVRFIFLDVRNLDRSAGLDPQSSSKTMLGATQKAWLKTQLVASEPVKVIISDVAWMGPASADAEMEANAQDKWWAYANERQEIADYITTNGVKTLMIHGDSHLMGASNRATNTWGGFPVWCVSPLANVGGGRNTSYFDKASYNTGQSTRGSQYGRITVTDNGTSIDFNYVGWDATNNVQRFSTTESFSTVDTTTNWFEWNGTTEIPLNLAGVWDGVAIEAIASTYEHSDVILYGDGLYGVGTYGS